MQQLNNGGSTHQLWQVVDHHYQDNSHSSIDYVLKSLRMKANTALGHRLLPIDRRLISPWLLTTRWHEHVTEYSITELHTLISSSSSTSKHTCIPGIQAAVLEYFNEALDLLSSTDELILKKLNSENPQKW